jgi:hypothetical protein
MSFGRIFFASDAGMCRIIIKVPVASDPRKLRPHRRHAAPPSSADNTTSPAPPRRYVVPPCDVASLHGTIRDELTKVVLHFPSSLGLYIQQSERVFLISLIPMATI